MHSLVVGLIGLPDDAKALILAFVTAGLTWVVAWVLAKFGLDFSKYVEPIALALSGAIITVIEAQLALIPPVFDDLVLAIIHAIVLALSGGLVFLLVRRLKAKSLRSLLA